uniref:peptidylprolyl isomerase n=1 Tax=Helicotheca tamesis TaxID=374047 RepID=A0A7S2IBW6_9STRA|mmetsp:Transcript_7798/g.10660  ORF Transcript_7798/g.10660 Transcript_7798/m.10660 type:complete len:198 (+) Transcript_7798:110-703(+)|eukprot:CAMPEP_0185727184 /NCGR_PEP_ID=MMETSP1171-20130828/2922_1 /TAXON_ID=374046 /ORGANISM="Helicotheca tamensis, Strain CCMP826" /LENGTH=197 /DNA_ID=CAMNT_0028395689 /DNA_START=89 /DNA_END=682 /DNA_ORIENTATION=-
MRVLLVLALGLAAMAGSEAFSGPATFTRSSTSLSMAKSDIARTDFIKQVGGMIAASTLATQPAFADDEVITLPSGVSYTVTKAGDGPIPTIGELCAIRFKAFAGQNKIDDIYDTPEPYYTRVGSGGMIKGVEEVIPMMRVGDRWVLTVPGKLAFGPKGRPASAGKPRIPGDATIVFDVEMVGLPGKEPELIDLIGDD